MLPSVSVIMPILNEERGLRDAVTSILRQDYPGGLEVVLAIAPCTDDTWGVARALAAEDPRVRLVENPTGRTPDGLNAALEASEHPVVVRVDGHGALSPGYIETAVRTLEETGAANVGGLMHAEGVSDLERAVALAMRSPLGIGGARFHVGGEAGPAPTVYLGVFRREWLDRVGGYDAVYSRAQDWELNHRIRQAGGVVWFTPDLSVTYRPRGTWRALARQFWVTGQWRREVARRHPGTLNPRYLAPPVAVAAIAVGAVGGLVWRPLWIVPGAYLGGVVVGGLALAKDESPAVAVRVPAVLAVMHTTWGAGFLRALVTPVTERARRVDR